MALIGDVTGLDELFYGGAPMLPDNTSYSMTPSGGVVSSNISGGFAKQQLQYFNASAYANVQYFLKDLTVIAYVKNFIEQNKGEKWIASLAIDDGVVEQYVVQFLGDPQIQETGYNGSLRMRLEVKPSFDPCYGQFISDFAPCMGSDMCQIFNLTSEGVEALPNDT